jgi:TRAP-type C4-dicarboxylate transport system permease small subunit
VIAAFRAVAMLAAAALTVVMLAEVACRYLLGFPLIWSTETVGMLTGVLFLFAAGPALADNAHVAVDPLAKRLPPRLREAILAAVLLLGLLPVLLWLAQVGADRTWSAWQRGEVDDVSPWRRPTWPFLAVITLGLLAFAASVLRQGIRLIRG